MPGAAGFCQSRRQSRSPMMLLGSAPVSLSTQRSTRDCCLLETWRVPSMHFSDWRKQGPAAGSVWCEAKPSTPGVVVACYS